MSPDELARWRARRRTTGHPYATPSIPPTDESDPEHGWPVVAADVTIMRGMVEEIRAEVRMLMEPGEVLPTLEAVDDALATLAHEIDRRYMP